MHPYPHSDPTPPESATRPDPASCGRGGCRSRRWRVCGRPGCSGLQAYPQQCTPDSEPRDAGPSQMGEPMNRAMRDSEPSPGSLLDLKPVETWRQDDSDPDLWHHASGIIVNTAALEERTFYYRVIRVPAAPAGPNG